MKEDWLVVANASVAKIFAVSKQFGQPRQLKLIQELNHPASRLRSKDLITDRSGVYRTNRGIGGGHAQDYDPKVIEMDKFAKEMAETIDYARTLNRFNKLIIVATPHFYGLLDKHLTSSIKDLIRKVIRKDYTGVVARDLLKLLFPVHATN
jgi:protein required for attachment to host cells